MSPIKPRLEKKIFIQAALEGRTIDNSAGRLCCAKPSVYLACLLHLYNQFFEAENRRFLASDIRHTQQQEQVQYLQFLRERRRRPPLPGFHLPEPAGKNTRKKSFFSYNKRNYYLEKI